MAQRHGFVQWIEGGRLREAHRRADEQVAEGRIEQAAYLDPGGRPAGIRSWLPWARPPQPRLRRPFDEGGRDVLGLFAEPPPELEDEQRAAKGIRRVVGRARKLSTRPGAEELVDDTWVGEPAWWRITEGVDFLVAREGRESVVVSFGLAPLVVALPAPVVLSAHLDRLEPETRALVPARSRITEPGRRVRVLPGDAVEIWGVCRPLSESARTFHLAGPATYRCAPRPARVIGDEDGTRLVIRVTASPYPPGSKTNG